MAVTVLKVFDFSPFWSQFLSVLTAQNPGKKSSGGRRWKRQGKDLVLDLNWRSYFSTRAFLRSLIPIVHLNLCSLWSGFAYGSDVLASSERNCLWAEKKRDLKKNIERNIWKYLITPRSQCRVIELHKNVYCLWMGKHLQVRICCNILSQSLLTSVLWCRSVSFFLTHFM